MHLINKEPVFKRGDLAVWMLADIPLGVLRYRAAFDVKGAFSSYALACRIKPTVAADLSVVYGLMACVAWTDLQPERPVPRGCAAMPALGWGTQRDADGVCMVCNADDSMWCDKVVHDQQLAAAHGATLIKTPLYGPERFERFIEGRGRSWLPHEPRYISRDPLGEPQRDWVIEGIQAVSSPRSIDRMLAATMGSRGGERYTPPSVEARAAWSRELRRLTQETQDRERNRVLVDRDFENWE